MRHLLLIFAFVCTLPACASRGLDTSRLSPPGLVALHAAEVVKVLDIIRDTAIDAEAAALISTRTARSVVTWHQAALTAIRQTPAGWKATVLAGLTALKTTFTPDEQRIFSPYIDAALATIQTVIP